MWSPSRLMDRSFLDFVSSPFEELIFLKPPALPEFWQFIGIILTLNIGQLAVFVLPQSAIFLHHSAMNVNFLGYKARNPVYSLQSIHDFQSRQKCFLK